MSEESSDPSDPGDFSSVDPFENLPEECLEMIFKKIDITDYFNISCVCKRFFVSLSEIWKNSSGSLSFMDIEEHGEQFIRAQIPNRQNDGVMMKFKPVLGPSGKHVVTEQMVNIISGVNRLCTIRILSFFTMELRLLVKQFHYVLPPSTEITYQFCDLSSISTSEFAEYAQTRQYDIFSVTFNGCDRHPMGVRMPEAREFGAANPSQLPSNLKISLPYALRSANGTLSATMSMEPFAKISNVEISSFSVIGRLKPEDIIGSEVEKIYKRLIGSEQPFKWEILDLKGDNSSLNQLIKIRPEKGYRPCIKIEGDMIADVTRYTLENWIRVTDGDKPTARRTKRRGVENSEVPATKKNRQLSE